MSSPFTGPTGGPQLVGSYAVNSGPAFAVATSYSCVQACALVFGGFAATYSCSTLPTSVNNVAYVDGYSDTSHCGQNPVSETFVVPANPPGGSYRAYGPGAFSAYVFDHSCPAVNYCFQ